MWINTPINTENQPSHQFNLDFDSPSPSPSPSSSSSSSSSSSLKQTPPIALFELKDNWFLTLSKYDILKYFWFLFSVSSEKSPLKAQVWLAINSILRVITFDFNNERLIVSIELTNADLKKWANKPLSDLSIKFLNQKSNTIDSILSDESETQNLIYSLSNRILSLVMSKIDYSKIIKSS